MPSTSSAIAGEGREAVMLSQPVELFDSEPVFSTG